MKSGNLVGWQARGFDSEFNSGTIKTLMFPGGQDDFMHRAAETQTPVRSATANDSGILEIVSKFGPITPNAVAAVPLVVRDKTVAILYADSGTLPNDSIDSHSLDMITTVVSLTVELSSARAKLGIKQPDAPSQAPATANSSAPAPVSPAPTVDRPPAEQQEQKQDAQPVAPNVGIAEPAVPEPPPSAPAVAPSEMHNPPSPQAIESLDEAEQKLHNEAKRFARLLVSEIKLYNEQKVQAGRRDKNLYSLLHDDIDKSRDMYEKRIAPSVAAKADYFYDELVRILADSQVGALGADCPGPAVVA